MKARERLFFYGKGVSKDPKTASYQTCQLHFYRKALQRNKITNKPSKSAGRTLDLVQKRDPVQELHLPDSDEDTDHSQRNNGDGDA
jgi:hypothetical protein